MIDTIGAEDLNFGHFPLKMLGENFFFELYGSLLILNFYVIWIIRFVCVCARALKPRILLSSTMKNERKPRI